MSLSNRKHTPELRKSAPKSSLRATNPFDWRDLKPEMPRLGEINTSPWNHFPLSELLLVPLIILYGTKESRVKPRLSTSLHLSRLRRLSRALALCPRGSCFSHRSHQKNKNERGEANRERYKHNQEKMNPIKSSRHSKMEKKSIVRHGSTPKLKP